MTFSHSTMSTFLVLLALSSVFQPCQAVTVLGPGMQVRLRPSNAEYADYYMRHQNFILYINESENTGLFERDSTWVVIPGLSGVGISFRSENYPDQFPQRAIDDGNLYLSQFEDNEVYAGEASWLLNAPLVPNGEENRVSLLSVSAAGQFMRHFDYQVRTDLPTNTEPFIYDATWIVETLETPELIGNWQLLWFYNNSNSSTPFTWEWTYEVGITQTDTITAANAWSSAITAEASYQMFEFTASIVPPTEQSAFVAATTAADYLHEYIERETVIPAFTSAYMWQWTMTAGRDNAFSLTNSFNHFEVTDMDQPILPPTLPTAN